MNLSHPYQYVECSFFLNWDFFYLEMYFTSQLQVNSKKNVAYHHFLSIYLCVSEKDRRWKPTQHIASAVCQVMGESKRGELWSFSEKN